jgi:hypothetical protein
MASAFKHAAEKRAKMRAAEHRYFESHPDKYDTKLDNNRRRYQENPEFRTKQLASTVRSAEAGTRRSAER